MPRPRKLQRRWLFALGLCCSVVAVGVGTWLLRDPMPTLTPQTFAAALARWSEHGPASYDLDVTVQGNQPGQIKVQVREGVVVAMSRDGIVPERQQTWDYWSVPGQFDMIQIELESQTDPRGEFAGISGSQLVLWAEFDPQYGYPRGYHRVLLGARQEMQWQVTRFEPVSRAR